MRVGTDGMLLAVSDAAMSLLGASELVQVLNTNLMDHLPMEAVGVWADFASRVLSSGTGSAECEMTDLAGAQRSVVLAGIALREHPDGLESLLVNIRDVSAARRLEASLREHDGLRQSIEELSAKLAGALADQQQFALAAAERNQLQSALDQADSERQQLRATVDEATAGRDDLRAALATAEARIQQLEMATADGHQLRAALDQTVAERQQLASELEQMVAERDELERAAREREAKRQRLFAEQACGRMKAEEALAEARAQLERLTAALNAVMEAASATRQVLGKEVQK